MHTTEAYGGVEVRVQLHALVTSALDRCEWSASRPSQFTQGDVLPRTYSVAVWAVEVV